MAFFASISSPTPTVPSHFSFHAAASTGAVFLSANWSGEKELSKGGASVSLPKWRMNVSIFTSLFTGKGKNNKEEIKYELLEAIAPLDRGADASPEDRDRIEKITSQLEAKNQVKEPLKSDFLNGKWELIYTTSSSILGLKRPKILRPNGNIFQAINADTLRGQNRETWPFFNQIPVKAPDRARGELEITYLDDEIRISRGDKGNLFILKMVDPSYRVPLS